ncbi:MAG: quinolinate synthase NadA [Elusimicrobia bacterium]|nr:quinolinate synthase NadA [Elusimicrobiota bacterium]
MDITRLINEIREIAQRKKAVILVHNYQLPEVQEVADFVGDSLELSIKASETPAEIIIFCGVHFMAETASIISPQKTVLIPDYEAGCPMASMINEENVKELRRQYPRAKVVCYVNSTAAVKAESYICCTSANAIKVVNSLKDTKEIIFIPDKYLGSYVQSKVPDKKFILWEGYCPTHARILKTDILKLKEQHPSAKVMVHSECTLEVIGVADAVLSTSGMTKFARETDAREFIVGTEIGMLYRLQKENPDKKFYPASNKALCPNMKLTTLEKVFWSLQDLVYPVKVEEPVRSKAKLAIERMIALSKQD